MTISSAFPVEAAAAEVAAAPASTVDRARAHARMRARDYRSLSVMVNKFANLGRQFVADLRDAWWTPASLPTFQTAWAERMPDRERVPGNNSLLYGMWVAYNHSVGLAAPLLAIALAGVLAVLVWVLRHPARAVLTAAITTALYFLTIR